MRLLNTSTLQVQNFHPGKVPHYAILSHRWGDDEVTFQDMQAPHEALLERPGYKKVQRFCQIALSKGFEFVWVDTCCIDKMNNTELSEAVNSMFDWYRSSVVCYAYLADVKTTDDITRSQWFTRGWTLQELIAPIRVLFYNSDWHQIGSKASHAKQIEQRTGIPSDVLAINSDQEYSVAQVFSWAAGRKTTRLEDEAYCLLGLLRIYIPLVYGEGQNAFNRLQREIINRSSDESIFAWAKALDKSGALASSPADFANCRDIERVKKASGEFQMTNKGLRIQLPLVPLGENVWAGILSCDNRRGFRCGIKLMEREKGEYNRVECSEIYWHNRHEALPDSQTVYITDLRNSAFDLYDWMIPSRWSEKYRTVVDLSSALRSGYHVDDMRTLKQGLRRFPLMYSMQWEEAESNVLSIPLPPSGFWGGLLLKITIPTLDLLSLGFTTGYLGWISRSVWRLTGH
ncbi:hypothetical protein S40293_01152 [Stachybotrys chartarum IBT 40293]|nr:hypothetical protein S40293_01152 [Stachybotrys chartarum IBT 40293]